MDPVLYNTMNGAKLDFNRQALIASNLSNATTPGFKSDLFQAQSMFIKGSGVSGEAIPVIQENGTDFTDGPLMTTGRDLDLAIHGKGWFAIQGQNGETYSRAGNFHVDENGMLVDGSRRPVMGDGGPISIPPAQSIEIGEDGTISIVPLDGPPGELAVLDQIKLVKIEPKDMLKNVDGTVSLRKGGLAPVDSTVTLVKGALEGSNVNSVQEMVHMIATGQDFSSKMRLIEAADSGARKLSGLLQD